LFLFLGDKMVVDRGGGPMKVFREGICLVMNFWWEIRCFVGRELGGNPQLKLNKLRHSLFRWFIESKAPPSVPSATMKLKELISLLEVDLIYIDNSLEEVCMYVCMHVFSIVLVIIFYYSLLSVCVYVCRFLNN
jgi:hypothetical protein